MPNVSYYAVTKKGEEIQINNPSDFPSLDKIESISEPYIKAQIITKSDFILCTGLFDEQENDFISRMLNDNGNRNP